MRRRIRIDLLHPRAPKPHGTRLAPGGIRAGTVFGPLGLVLWLGFMGWFGLKLGIDVQTTVAVCFGVATAALGVIRPDWYPAVAPRFLRRRWGDRAYAIWHALVGVVFVALGIYHEATGHFPFSRT